jgi:hypothetical protein
MITESFKGIACRLQYQYRRPPKARRVLRITSIPREYVTQGYHFLRFLFLPLGVKSRPSTIAASAAVVSILGLQMGLIAGVVSLDRKMQKETLYRMRRMEIGGQPSVEGRAHD